jgi:hypothetical protein
MYENNKRMNTAQGSAENTNIPGECCRSREKIIIWRSKEKKKISTNKHKQNLARYR